MSDSKKPVAKKIETLDNQTHMEHGQQEAPNAKPLQANVVNTAPQPKPRPRD